MSFDHVCLIMSHCCIAQAIQRQLEEVAEKQRDLEERGVAVEKTIRGETGTEQNSHRPDSGLQRCMSPNKTLQNYF